MAGLSSSDRFRQLFQELLKAKCDEDLRPISNTGCVTLPPTSPSWYRCSWCNGNIVHCEEDLLFQRSVPVTHACRMCQNIVYCSPQCQGDGWKKGGHRVVCRRVRRCRKAISESSRELREDNGVMDVFDRSNEMVFRLASADGLGSVGQNHLNERWSLVLAYMEQAVAPMAHGGPPPHWDSLALEFALEHCMDLLHLDPVNAECWTRSLVVHCLLVLERYQELYDFVKYWSLLPHKLRDIQKRLWAEHENETGIGDTLQFALGPNTFLSVKKEQSMFEHQSELALRPPSRCTLNGSVAEIQTFPGPSKVEVVNILYLALAKIRILQTLKGLGLMALCLPIEPEPIAARIGGFLGMKVEWQATDPETMKQQCYQLLAFADESIPGILMTLIDCSFLPRGTEVLSFGDGTFPALELLKTEWMSSKFAWDFLLVYVGKENNLQRLVRVPRNSFLLEVLDRIYQQYIADESNRSRRVHINEHWDRVKHTPAVRQLLLEQMEEGHLLYGRDFSVSRVLMALIKEQKLSTTNKALLLGDADIDQDVVEEERFLAREHLDQVRHRPDVAQFIKLQSVHIPDGRLDAMDVKDCLTVMGLATESNLKLLFGNDGWVATLFQF